jgi:ketosteroid isomerase-like protein
MSQENVELVHRAYEALQADDIDAFLTFVHPDVEWHSLILEIEGVFHGHDGVREWWRGLRSVFPDWQPSVVEARDYGRHVVIHARGVGSGAASGIGVNDDFWQVAEIREQQMIWYRAVRTEREALEVAGLQD